MNERIGSRVPALDWNEEESCAAAGIGCDELVRESVTSLWLWSNCDEALLARPLPRRDEKPCPEEDIVQNRSPKELVCCYCYWPIIRTRYVTMMMIVLCG